MNPHVIALNGSPRRKGNTDALLASALAGAAGAGATVETLVLNDMQVRPCQACGHCEKHGVCPLAERDDMRLVYEALDRGARFVAASPIYFASVSAQMKGVIDRCQVLWARKYRLNRAPATPDRKGVFLAVGGFPHRRFWPCAETVVRTWFTCSDIQYLGGLFYQAIDARGDIEAHPTALQEVREAGRRLVQGLGPDRQAAGAAP